MSKAITSDDILGKEAIDPRGEIIGVVVKLHVDKVLKQISGITIDQGLMKPDLFVGIDYVKNFGIDTVFLNKVPIDSFIGMKVITSHGKIIGYVKDLVTNKTKVQEFIVKVDRNFTKDQEKIINVEAREIEQIGGSIILKKKFKVKNAKENTETN